MVLKNTQICSVADAGLFVAMENLAVKALQYNVYPPDPTYEVCTHMHTDTVLYYIASDILDQFYENHNVIILIEPVLKILSSLSFTLFQTCMTNGETLKNVLVKLTLPFKIGKIFVL